MKNKYILLLAALLLTTLTVSAQRRLKKPVAEAEIMVAISACLHPPRSTILVLRSRCRLSLRRAMTWLMPLTRR